MATVQVPVTTCVAPTLVATIIPPGLTLGAGAAVARGGVPRGVRAVA
jgi:hypothetical protein